MRKGLGPAGVVVGRAARVLLRENLMGRAA
jgi:hypothetical protein